MRGARFCKKKKKEKKKRRLIKKRAADADVAAGRLRDGGPYERRARRRASSPHGCVIDPKSGVIRQAGWSSAAAANFGGLVLCCMDSYDSEQRRIFPHFSRSTRFAFLCTFRIPSVQPQILQSFAPLIFAIFSWFCKILLIFCTMKSTVFHRDFHRILLELRRILANCQISLYWFLRNLREITEIICILFFCEMLLKSKRAESWLKNDPRPSVVKKSTKQRRPPSAGPSPTARGPTWGPPSPALRTSLPPGRTRSSYGFIFLANFFPFANFFLTNAFPNGEQSNTFFGSETAKKGAFFISKSCFQFSKMNLTFSMAFDEATDTDSEDTVA